MIIPSHGKPGPKPGPKNSGLDLEMLARHPGRAWVARKCILHYGSAHGPMARRAWWVIGRVGPGLGLNFDRRAFLGPGRDMARYAHDHYDVST
jgi:hypothetical protein